MNTQTPRILLIQMNKDAALLEREFQGFSRHADIPEECISILNLAYPEAFHPDILDDYQALFIGMLPEDYCAGYLPMEEQLPFLPELGYLIRRAIDLRLPCFLSSGGFTLASIVLGGKVALIPSQIEFGVFPVELTRDARLDPIFSGFSDRFHVVTVHCKSTIELPHGCVLLASSERCPIQAFRLLGRPFYAFQFTPEYESSRLVVHSDACVEGLSGLGAYENKPPQEPDLGLVGSLLKRFMEEYVYG